MSRRSTGISRASITAWWALLAALQVHCSAEHEILSSDQIDGSAAGGGPSATGGSPSATGGAAASGGSGVGAVDGGGSGGQLSGGGGVGGADWGTGATGAGAGTSFSVGGTGLLTGGGAGVSTGGSSGGGAGGSGGVAASGGGGGTGNVAGTTAGTGAGGATQCDSVYECAMGSVCNDGMCFRCEPQNAQCPDDCAYGSTKMVLDRNGCTVCECLPASECKSNADCSEGEICYPGAQCEEGCSDPSCCHGNQCSAPGCAVFTAPCSVVGCEAGAHCDSTCAPYDCECVDGSVMCELVSAGSGGAAGTAGAAGGTYSSCACGSP